MNEIEEDVLKLATGGNIAAFERIYRRFSGLVYNVALGITRNSADAEEVTQDVFMNIYRSLKNFQFRSAFKTWVYRIAVNTAINRYRKSARERKDTLDYESLPEGLMSTPAGDGELARSDDANRLNAFLKNLNPEYKACLILREIEGLSYREIADSLKIPLNTVRSRLKRSREALLGRSAKE